MRIKKISLLNFRNFQQIGSIDFPDKPLLIAAAPNATGKTNFLESIIILLRGKSFRASYEECVAWNSEYFLVRGEVERDALIHQLAVQYHVPTKKLRIEEDSIPVSPVTFYSHYPYVLFLPDDGFIFHRGPASRRNFLNTLLVSSPVYVTAIVQYHRVLRQRNALLKKTHNKNDIRAWTDMLVQHASTIWMQRQACVDYLNTHLRKMYITLFHENLSLELSLTPGASNPAKFADLLDEAWEYERKYAYTLYGPHRDDLSGEIDGKPIRSALSRGQIRSCVIALKIAACGFVKQLTGQQPIVLLDDILSELDEKRQEALLDHLPSFQTILTCTTLPESLNSNNEAMLDLRKIISGQTIPDTAPTVRNRSVDISVMDEIGEDSIPIRA